MKNTKKCIFLFLLTDNFCISCYTFVKGDCLLGYTIVKWLVRLFPLISCSNIKFIQI